MAELVIDKDTFKGADSDTKLLLVFDLIVENNRILSNHVTEQKENCTNRAKTCDSRFEAMANRIKKVESRKRVDGVIAGGGGIIGGFLAIIIKMKIWP